MRVRLPLPAAQAVARTSKLRTRSTSRPLDRRVVPHPRIADARGNDATEVACPPSSWVPTQQTTLDEENLQCKGGGRSYELIVLLDSIIPA